MSISSCGRFNVANRKSQLTYGQSCRRRYVDQLIVVIKSMDVENSRCVLSPERANHIRRSPIQSPYDVATLKSSVGRSHQFCSFCRREMSSLGHLIFESHYNSPPGWAVQVAFLNVDLDSLREGPIPLQSHPHQRSSQRRCSL